MPKFISIETEIDIRRLSKQNYSYRQIKNKLKEEGIDVNIMTICCVLKNIGIRRQALHNNQPIPKFRRPPTKRTIEMIQKVKSLVNKENPTSYQDIKNKTKLTLPIIHKIIHQDLNFETRKKTRVHKLIQTQKKNRKKNWRKLYINRLASDRWEYIVTLDQTLIHLDDSNG